MELATAMHNALMIKNSSMGRPTAKTGIMIWDTMEVAVLNSMSGRQINSQMPTLPIHARSLDTIDARVANVVMDPKDKMEFVTKMDVT